MDWRHRTDFHREVVFSSAVGSAEGSLGIAELDLIVLGQAVIGRGRPVHTQAGLSRLVGCGTLA